MKRIEKLKPKLGCESHPAGVRGLKQVLGGSVEETRHVAPRRGAWVETDRSDEEKIGPYSRTPQGCVG